MNCLLKIIVILFNILNILINKGMDLKPPHLLAMCLTSENLKKITPWSVKKKTMLGGF